MLKIEAEQEKKVPLVSMKKLVYLFPLSVLVFVTVVIAYAYFVSTSFSSTVSYLLNGYEVQASSFVTFTYEIEDSIPSDVRNEISKKLSGVNYEGIDRFVGTHESPDILISLLNPIDERNLDNPLSFSVVLYKEEVVPVGHFYWINDSISAESLKNLVFYTTKDSEHAVKVVLGSLSDQLTVLESQEDLIDALLTSDENTSVGLIKPEYLSPQMKLLDIDGDYYLDSPDKGSLKSTIIASSRRVPKILLNTIPIHLSSINEPSNDTTVSPEILTFRMTGVTAISRNLALKLEASKDYDYPAQKLGEFLSSADITHTSNEVSFVDGCLPEQSLRFCASTKYFETLLTSGIDIVELTGNHNNDYGYSNNTKSINMYVDNEIEYFGGGLDAIDAAKILYLEEKGSIIALVGYNYFDTMLGTGAIASNTHSGANSYSSEKLESDIAKARENADIVIVDFQFQECYSYPSEDVIYPLCYRPLSAPDQRAVFREAADFGADIVIGTQAHQPQTYEIYDDAIIFYGLGNLYFDQIRWIGTRQGLILTHYFIDGEYVQTKIDTTIYDGDMIPYLTDGDKRELILKLLSEAR